jgi:hypothetical protein
MSYTLNYISKFLVYSTLKEKTIMDGGGKEDPSLRQNKNMTG